MLEHEAEAELRLLLLLLLRATLRDAEQGLPELVAVPGVEASTRQLQPKFARCCKARPGSSLRRTPLPTAYCQSGHQGAR